MRVRVALRSRPSTSTSGTLEKLLKGTDTDVGAASLFLLPLPGLLLLFVRASLPILSLINLPVRTGPAVVAAERRPLRRLRMPERRVQRVPVLVVMLLESNGAERLLPRGQADAAGVGFLQDFEELEGRMWDVLDEVCLLFRFSHYRPGAEKELVELEVWIQRREWGCVYRWTDGDAQRGDR